MWYVTWYRSWICLFQICGVDNMISYIIKQTWKLLIVNIVLLVSMGVLIFDMFTTNLDSLHRLAFSSIIGAVLALVVSNSVIRGFIHHYWVYKLTEAELKFCILFYMKDNMPNEVIKNELTKINYRYHKVLGSKNVDIIINNTLDNNMNIDKRLEDTHSEIKRCDSMLAKLYNGGR